MCAAYSRAAAGILERQIQSEDYCIIHALEKMKYKPVLLRHSAYPDEILQNINSPNQYRELRRRVHGTPVIAVSGVKNSGKTTLITGILPLLKKQGLRIAVIKHDGHDFSPDVPDTDSYRIRHAGARSVAVYSDHRYMITEEMENVSPEELTRRFQEADLILLEGGKNNTFPKLEVVRGAVSNTFACAQDSLIGLCTDANLRLRGRTLPIDDYAGIVELLMEYLRKQSSL